MATHVGLLKRMFRKKHGLLESFAILLFVSVGLRFLAFSNLAIAEDSAPVESSETQPLSTCMDDIGLQTMLEDLLQREKHIQSQELLLTEKERSIQYASDQVQRNLQDLKATQDHLAALIAVSDGAAEADLARLTSVYESMKPKDAAALFEAMEPDFAAGFLARMRPDAAASVLSGISPATAYAISVVLAGRNVGTAQTAPETPETN
jgi:flagellar motility protein MotE (MotC chaperone)